ncbi:MAG: LytTR family DNA-binding domain-containing protein [Alishewanella sp.]|nr:LytTR family DNA-binding domain-containing protein [Alishewanella sp.]MDP5035747.1 LytTR family DNA-binding domain-containing protein [Alishewanella sp.]
MFRVAIVEDEPLARSKLRRLIAELPDPMEVVAELATIKETAAFLTSGQAVDVIFSDIELADGNVLTTYQQIPPCCPLIFITAYDQFMLSAFDSQGISYLLKPYNSEKLLQAWQKFRLLSAKTVTTQPDLSKLTALLAQLPATPAVASYATRIAIRQQQQIYFLDIADISYIQADGGLIMAFDAAGKRHYLPYTSLQAVEAILDPQRFFRINRSELVQTHYIERLERFCKNTLTVFLRSGVQLKTSQSRTSEFSRWLGI